MGLDMRPMGKPKQGYEKRFQELFKLISEDNFPKPSFFDKIKGKKMPSKEDYLKEWFDMQITTYETIKAPRVGRDDEAEIWLKEKYEELEEQPSTFEEFRNHYEGYYVIELAKEKDGLPMYIAMGQDENVFRGQFLEVCKGVISDKLLDEAWETKLAPDTLDYGERLLNAANKVAKKHGLEYLKDQVQIPDKDEDDLEFKLHVIFSLARWLIFYGKNGHGYEADF